MLRTGHGYVSTHDRTFCLCPDCVHTCHTCGVLPHDVPHSTVHHIGSGNRGANTVAWVCVASASPCGRRCGGLPATRPAASPPLRGVNTFSVSFFCPSGTLDTAAPQFSQNLAVGSSACPHCGQYRIFPITAPLSFCQSLYTFLYSSVPEAAFAAAAILSR